MTIIAAAVGPDGTWIGSDGMSGVDGVIHSRNCRKWSLSTDRQWAWAAAGEVTYDSVLRPELLPAVKFAGKAGAGEVVDWMRETLRAAPEFECQRGGDDTWGDYHFSPVVCTEGHVWRVNSDLRTLNEAIDGVFCVAGCGDDFAIGAMSALIFQHRRAQDAERDASAAAVYDRLPAEMLVRAGIEAACHHSIHCGGEIFVERLG